MSDAIEKARELLRRIEDQMTGIPFQRSDAQILCQQHAAALDLIEALKRPPLGCTCGCGRRFYSVVLRDHPSTTDFHAEAEQRFEDAICGGK